jgi:hypothetical protein
VTQDAFLLILGNIYLPLCTEGTSEQMVLEFESLLENVLSLYPTDPVIIGGDFNCHLFSGTLAPERVELEAQFRVMVRRLRSVGFKIFPEQESPFTFQNGTTSRP